ncbi:MAG: hypothetical protein J6P54_05340 [Bacteroidales bacterium]|nr:hypothetical protein [Bacteroidales bacterium]
MSRVLKIFFGIGSQQNAQKFNNLTFELLNFIVGFSQDLAIRRSKSNCSVEYGHDQKRVGPVPRFCTPVRYFCRQEQTAIIQAVL